MTREEMRVDKPKEMCYNVITTKRGDKMPTDLEIKERLIAEYKRLMRIRQLAEMENATETLKEIDREISYIKLTLQPLELPNN